MVTNIQIKDETIKHLKILKEKMNLKTYNEVVKRLIKMNNSKSMAGSLSYLNGKELLNDLRDKQDRF